jgi:ribosomal protein L11 methyltransferase
LANYFVVIPVSDEEKDILVADLFEAGTTGISETEQPGGQWLLQASFDTAEQAAGFGVEVQQDLTDWVTISHMVWTSRLVGERFFFTPSWSDEPTPEGRWRIHYQDGAACGSGEHPSTRQCLVAIEEYLTPNMRMLDLGCGAGLLSLGAKLLGAGFIVGVDVETDSCHLTRELSGVPVVQGMPDCLAGEKFDLVAANISATVLVNFADEIIRAAKPGGRIVLAGFGVEEAALVKQVFALGSLSERTEGEWSCIVLDLPLN